MSGTQDALTARIKSFTGAMSARQPYRPPDQAEQSSAGHGFAALLTDDRPANAELAGLGFTRTNLLDPVTHRPLTLIQHEPGSERAWGMYLIDRTAAPSLAVEVPHPAFDLHSELFGLDLFRATPGAVLAIAGAHRRADGNRADVAHDPDSLFQVMATYLSGRGLAQVQLHGFDNESAPGYDIVLSTGTTRTSAAAIRAGEGFRAAGVATCLAWARVCAGLEGTTNVQGKVAANDGTVFLHVELSRTVRNSGTYRTLVGTVLADADIGR